MNIAVIPARKASKSIINKNLQKLGTKDLIDRAVKSAMDAGFFDRIILSTDIETKIIDYEDQTKIEVILRTQDLATDQTKMIEVILSLIENEKLNGTIWILQPTSPYRLTSDFESIKKMMLKASSVISVSVVGGHHPDRMYTVHDGKLFPLKTKRSIVFKNRQDLDQVFIRSGHYYVADSKDILENKSFFIQPSHAFIIPEERASNIDSQIDLIYAKAIQRVYGL